MYDPDSYRAMSWAEDLDTDLDGQVSQEEISRWMRETLDADGESPHGKGGGRLKRRWTGGRRVGYKVAGRGGRVGYKVAGQGGGG